MSTRTNWLKVLIVTAFVRPPDCNGNVGGGTPQPPRFPCVVTEGTNWTAYILDQQVEQPRCPVPVPWRLYRVDFVAGFEAYNEYVAPDPNTFNQVIARIADHNFQVRDSASAEWVYSQYGIAEAEMRGSYAAGWNFGDEDYALLSTGLFNAGPNYLAQAQVDLPLEIVVNASISGTSQEAEPGNWVTVTLTVDPADFDAPVIYTWQLNEGPLGSNSNSVTVQLPEVGDYQFIGTAWDTTGNVAQETWMVQVRYPECPECNAPTLDTSTTGGAPSAKADRTGSGRTKRPVKD
jgi:hypothetical protein